MCFFFFVFCLVVSDWCLFAVLLLFFVVCFIVCFCCCFLFLCVVFVCFLLFVCLFFDVAVCSTFWNNSPVHARAGRSNACQSLHIPLLCCSLISLGLITRQYMLLLSPRVWKKAVPLSGANTYSPTSTPTHYAPRAALDLASATSDAPLMFCIV